MDFGAVVDSFVQLCEQTPAAVRLGLQHRAGDHISDHRPVGRPFGGHLPGHVVIESQHSDTSLPGIQGQGGYATGAELERSRGEHGPARHFGVFEIRLVNRLTFDKGVDARPFPQGELRFVESSGAIVGVTDGCTVASAPQAQTHRGDSEDLGTRRTKRSPVTPMAQELRLNTCNPVEVVHGCRRPRDSGLSGPDSSKRWLRPCGVLSPGMDDTGMELARRFSEIARSLLTAEDEGATLAKITEVAVDVIDGCESAGIDIIQDGKIFAVAATSPLASLIDDIQVEVGEGPCLQALRDHEVFSTGDLEQESRWPTFARRAYEETGIRSIMGFRLFADEDTMGALDLYSSQPDAFDADTETVGLVLATQASIALSTSRSRKGLEEALATRDVIGQAKGILMERNGIGAEAAFDLLREASQQRNIKLRRVAEMLILDLGENAGGKH